MAVRLAGRLGLTLAVALCGSLLVSAAEAASKRGAGLVVVRGCTAPYGACLGLSAPRGVLYNLYDNAVWAPLGVGVRVTGQATAFGPCGAPGIRVVAWRPDRSVKCTWR